MATSDMGLKNGIHSAAAIKKICLDAGADDAGLVALDREELQKERDGIQPPALLERSFVA